jgi:hypothetical protein
MRVKKLHQEEMKVKLGSNPEVKAIQEKICVQSSGDYGHNEGWPRRNGGHSGNQSGRSECH